MKIKKSINQKASILNYKAFTLIEILLYISIFSVLVFTFSAFLTLIFQSRVKFQTVSEVDQQGLQVSRLITQTVRNAKKINLPIQGASGDTLSLDLEDPLKTPTIFNSSGTNLQIKEGTDAIVPLTSSVITVSGLSFQNVSKNNTSGTMKFQFTLTYINNSGRNEYDYTKTFYGSASLRYN